MMAIDVVFHHNHPPPLTSTVLSGRGLLGKYKAEDNNNPPKLLPVSPSSKGILGAWKPKGVGVLPQSSPNLPRFDPPEEATKALGPLFKLTESNLWDEPSPEVKRPSANAAGLKSKPKKSRLPFPPSSYLHRYWRQRYLLFARFDEGIQMDEEGWFSVTPEPIAKHQAFRCRGCKTIVDCFAGAGGNTIQFALNNQKVIAIDIDPKKTEFAKHNAAVYGIDGSRVEFLTGDSMVLGPGFKADAVFLSPPWGGPGYLKEKKFDIMTMLKPRGGQFLFDLARKIAPKVVMYLPRNIDVNQLAELALSASPPWSLEVEKNYLNGNLKAITAYFAMVDEGFSMND